MRSSRIRSKLANNEPVLVTTLHFCDPAVFEMASVMGFDALWIDMEHHVHTLHDAQNFIRAAHLGTADVLVRPAKSEFMRLGRMLEAGAQGILYPRCDNAEEAAELVKWAKFPPLGKRGCDGGNRDNPYCSTPTARYIREANEQTFLVAQIEDPAALEHVEAIAEVDGIDVLFLGPGDFSSLAGIPGQVDHPLVQEASQRIAAAARRAGKHWGRPVNNAADAQKWMEHGARFFSCASDLLIVKDGLQRLVDTFAATGFTLDNEAESSTVPNAQAKPHFRPQDLAAVSGSRANGDAERR